MDFAFAFALSASLTGQTVQLTGSTVQIVKKPAPPSERMVKVLPTMKKLSPILLVEAIEPCLPFWIERLGFQKTAEVQDGDRLGFVILSKDDVEVMYQTRHSMEHDVPALATGPAKTSTILYLEVEKLDTVIDQLAGYEFVVPKRRTFYGATEIFVREPGGSVVAFASHEHTEPALAAPSAHPR